MSSLLYCGNTGTNLYDMWATPFPQIDKLVLSGSFQTMISQPVHVPILSNNTLQFNNETKFVQSDNETSSIEDSPPNNTSSIKQNENDKSGQKKKKPVTKKPVHLGPCFFPHGCVCGHNVRIRDLFINTRERRNPSSVTIQIKTKPVNIGLRNR